MISFYADGFSIVAGLVDTKIDFLAVDPVKDEKGAVIGEKQIPEYRISMSLPLAKELRDQLAFVIKQYEDSIGPITDLKSLREKLQGNGK